MTSTPGNAVPASGCSRSEEPAFTGVGWPRKTLAIGTHLCCLALFGFLVVWPVVSPLARGELAREFEPLRQAWRAWSSDLVEEAQDAWRGDTRRDGAEACAPVCVRMVGR